MPQPEPALPSAAPSPCPACARSLPLVAVDVGNSRTKLGLFLGQSPGPLPQPARAVGLAGEGPDLDRIAQELLAGVGRVGSWWIGSVNRPAATRLLDWLREHRPEERVVLLASGDLPLAVALDRPDMVGIDRLLDAVAANHLRQPGQPAMVVDVGSAITVNLISAEGAFLGGSILPGIAMSARAMHAFTDLLPLLDMSELGSPPPPLGDSTMAAMRSGLFWGAVGAIRELVRRLAGNDPPQVQVFLTGGASPAVAGLLGETAQHVPHLTLAGIALTAATAVPER